MGSAGMNHIFVEPVKGSREISSQKAACRQSRPHRVSYRLAASSTPAPLRDPLPLKGAQDVTGPAFVSPLRPPSFRAMGSAGMNHIFVKTVKGSREISQQIAACRPPRPHRVSYRLAVSSTSSPLRGSLLHRKASHVVFRSLTLPCKPRSLAPKKTQGLYVLSFPPSTCHPVSVGWQKESRK